LAVSGAEFYKPRENVLPLPVGSVGTDIAIYLSEGN